MTPHGHGLLCKFLERKTGCPDLDTAPFRKIELPRDMGKTTLGTIAYVLQRCCANPGIAVLIANEKVENAQAFLGAIKHHLETSQLLRALFPEIIPPEKKDDTWAASKVNLPGHTGRPAPTISTIGVGGTVTGMHFDLIVVDDMLSREAMENARAGGSLMGQLNRWVNQLRSLLDQNAEPFPEILFIGTRWWYGDSYEHIEEHYGYGEPPKKYLLRMPLPDGTKQALEATRVGDLAIFRRRVIEHGKSILPEKWSLDTLAKMRLGDPVLFAANMMNEPSDEVTAELKQGWLKPFQWIAPHERFQFTDGTGKLTVLSLRQCDLLLFVDPGGFGASVGGDRMRPAAVLTGTVPGGSAHVLLDCYSEQDTFLGCAQHVLQWCRMYQPRKMLIERAGQQAAFIELVRRMAKEQGIGVTIEEIPAGSREHDKDRRILELEPYFQQGMMYIGTGPQFQEFRTQYEQFPRSRRKDLLDALAWGPHYWRKTHVSGQRPAEQAQAGLAAYRQRRGMTV